MLKPNDTAGKTATFSFGSMCKGDAFFDVFPDRRAKSWVFVIGQRDEDGTTNTLAVEIAELDVKKLFEALQRG